MKKTGLLVFAGLLVSLLAFSGCGNIPSGSGDILSESITSSGEDASVSDNNVSTVSIDLSRPMITITSDGETIKTHASILSDYSWDGEHFVCADFYPVDLPEIADRLSVVTYAEDFAIQYREDISFIFIRIYEDSFVRLYNNVDLSYLDELSEGTYYIGVVVGRQGDYIKSENEYESGSYECVFKLIVNE